MRRASVSAFLQISSSRSAGLGEAEPPPASKNRGWVPAALTPLTVRGAGSGQGRW